jgi:ABC-2 type transport system permease protein
MAGLVITVIGGLIAGIPQLWEPLRLFYLVLVLAVTSLSMLSFMFLLMVRVSDPLAPRAIFGGPDRRLHLAVQTTDLKVV